MMPAKAAAAALSAASLRLTDVVRAMEAVRALGVDQDTDEALADTIRTLSVEADALELSASILTIDARWSREQRKRGLTVPAVKEAGR